MSFAKFLRTPFLIEKLRWLLLARAGLYIVRHLLFLSSDLKKPPPTVTQPVKPTAEKPNEKSRGRTRTESRRNRYIYLVFDKVGLPLLNVRDKLLELGVYHRSRFCLSGKTSLYTLRERLLNHRLCISKTLVKTI